MKKIILMLTLSTGILQAQNIKLKGSDTVLPLAQKEAESYKKAGKGSVSVTGGGSGVGIAALMDGSTDIAASSRKMKMDEKMKLQEAGKKIKEVIIAQDALSVIVHPANKISKLTREQLEGIFTGKIKNWKELGGENLNIVVYSRESSSGTYEFFKEHVLNKKNFANSVLSMPATGAIVQSVSQTKGAIGYIGIAYDNNSVKQLSVSYNQGKSYVEPTVQNAMNSTYPIVRPLYLYYVVSSEKTVKPFIDFILSSGGQAIVKSTGYIPVKK
ncbi:MAG: phosphate ABC transporter substrate-binding protein [Bacteroidetes bacterium]|nr:phosphate ABC transporter substrate-binding protein [Bacteroidota bacterium]